MTGVDLWPSGIHDAVLCRETDLPEPPAEFGVTFRVHWYHRVDGPPGQYAWRGVALCGTEGEFKRRRPYPAARPCPDCQRAESLIARR